MFGLSHIEVIAIENSIRSSNSITAALILLTCQIGIVPYVT